MRRPTTTAATLALLVLLVFPAPAQGANSCYECHSKLDEERLANPARQIAKSVHRHEGISCTGCHGGDPEQTTASAHDHPSFRGRPPRLTIPEVCGSCHADPRVIRRYNASLSLDQLALYEDSHHGIEALREGNEKAPVCTTCHGVHDIPKVNDPRSPVRREAVAELCGGCHSDPETVGSELVTSQLPQWRNSAHGKALWEGNHRAPSCPQCHGSHGATPPAVDSVGQTCGRCHLDELEAFDRGPHAKAFRKLGFAECLPCHGSHDIRAARPLVLGLDAGAACGKCHKGDNEPRAVAAQLTRMVKEATDRAAAAEVTVKRAEREGLFIPGTEAALSEMKTAIEKLEPALHSLNPKTLAKPVKEAKAAADRAEAIVTRARSLRGVERRGYYIVIIIIALLFGLVLVKARSLSTRRSKT